MTITQRLMKPGAFRIGLKEGHPFSAANAVALFDHIVITANRLEPITGFSDANILANAIFTGVVTNKPMPGSFEGHDLGYWLGTPDGAGDLLDTAVANAANSTLSTWITSLKPASLAAGTVNNTGTTTRTLGPFQWVTRREAIDAVCRAMGAEWKINPNFTLDVATPANLFVTTPTVVVTRLAEGPDGAFRGLDGRLILKATDVEQYTTSVICVAQGSGSTVATAAASSGATTYKDGLNNNVIMERLVNSPTEPSANAGTVAQATLDLYKNPRWETSLNSRTYTVTRFVKAGDYVYVYDQLAGLTDNANQIVYRGEVISPIKLRVYALTWPVEKGMGVYARRSGATPTYTDLTDFVQWETGDVNWEVGAATRAIGNDTASAGSVAYLGANVDVAERATSFTIPRWALTSTAAQAVATGTSTALAWNSERSDVLGFHAGSDAFVTVPAAAAGLYVVSYSVRVALNAAGGRAMWVEVNGVGVNDRYAYQEMVSAGADMAYTGSCVLNLAVGDVVRVIAYHTAGANLNYTNTGAVYNEFSGMWVGG